ncbi:hypothetical protein GOODEAATRI_033699, partial [Goodea atripinnis]
NYFTRGRVGGFHYLSLSPWRQPRTAGHLKTCIQLLELLSYFTFNPTSKCH